MPKTLAVGTIAGILACLLIAVLLYTRRRGLADSGRFNAWQGVPVVASIPHTDTDHALLPADELARQGIKSLATAIDLMTLDLAAVTVSLTGVADSPDAGFVAANLAAATTGPMLLVDADIRNGQLHQRFDVAPSPGLAEVLAGTVQLEAALHEPAPGLRFLAGGDGGGPLEPQALADFTAGCQPAFPVVVITTPSATVAEAAAAITRQCTVALLVAASRHHSQGALDTVIETMARHNADIRGLVFNGENLPPADYEAAPE